MPPSEKGAWERLEDWLKWKIGRPLTHDERHQLRNLIRGILDNVFTLAQELLGKPLE